MKPPNFPQHCGFMLKIQFQDKRQPPVWVVEKQFSIGSAPDNNLVIQDASVSPYHARLLNEQGEFLLQDVGSVQGTFVNGRRINQRHIGCRDTIRCGNVEIDVLTPFADEDFEGNGYWALIADASWLTGQEFPLTPQAGDSVLIGRGNQCDIVFPGTHLSREHARITLADDHVVVRDLNSANGTYVNDTRVTGEATAVAGDRIRLDIYSFTLLGPGMAMPQSASSRLAGSRAEADGGSAASSGPKRWKTRPTSPGNREETQRNGTNPALIALSVLLIGALVVAVAYLLLN